MSPEQIDILLHTSKNGRYVSTEPMALELASLGLLDDYGPQALAGGDHYLTLTAKGRAELRKWHAAQPKPKPMSKRKRLAKERFRRFSSWRDAYGLSFREFLQYEKAHH